MKLHDGNELHIVDMGIRVVGKRYVDISISPEELIEYINDVGYEKATRYLRMLMKHYKQND